MSRFLNGSVTTPVHFLSSGSTDASCINQFHLKLYPYEIDGVNEGLEGMEEDASILLDHLMQHPSFKKVLDSFVFNENFSDISQVPVYQSKYQYHFEIPTIYSTIMDTGITNHAIQIKHENTFNLIFHVRTNQLPVIVQNFLLGFYTCLLDVYYEHYATSEEKEYVRDVLCDV